MTFASQFHMPGAYHFDPPSTTSGPALSAGIFRPPVSPSASSSVLNLAKSTGSLYSDASATTTPASNAKRKRARDDGGPRESTPLADWTNMNMDATCDPVSPMGIAENDRMSAHQRRYVLAGQIQTPGVAVNNPLEGNLEDSVYSDIDYRRALGSKRPHDDMESPLNRLATLHIDSIPPPAPDSQGWNVFTTIGGVVGKVWEFCKAGAFRGFYAGGGKSYDASGRVWCNEHDIPTLQTDETALNLNGANGLPGGFPQSDYMPYIADYHELSTPETTPQRPAAKRRQVGEVGDDLRRNWVMVQEPDQQNHSHNQMRKRASLASTTVSSVPTRASSRLQQRPTAPNRRISIPVSRLGGGTPNLNRRPSSRISHAGSPSLTAREPASFAQPRSPASASRPTFSQSSRIPVPSSHSANPFARAASPRPSSRHSAIPSPINPAFSVNGHRRDHSGASAASMTPRRKNGLDADDIEASPRLNAEAKVLATRKLAAERDADARIEAFNARLRDMIRQGKEALGTTVEVDGGDGQWMDDDE